MSSSILRQIEACGTYQAGSTVTESLGAAAQAAGLTHIILSLEEIGGKEQFLAVLGRALHFPEWFGDNWDALQDCLTDLSWLPADHIGYVIELSHAGQFAIESPEDFATALAIFHEATEYWREQETPFWVVLHKSAKGTFGLPELGS